jgi:thiamine pyrophosphate-dependent acetolactate synthase large subunit-like protein
MGYLSGKQAFLQGGIAGALSVPGEHVEKASDVGGAIGRGLSSGGPYLVDVGIDVMGRELPGALLMG